MQDQVDQSDLDQDEDNQDDEDEYDDADIERQFDEVYNEFRDEASAVPETAFATAYEILLEDEIAGPGIDEDVDVDAQLMPPPPPPSRRSSTVDDTSVLIPHHRTIELNPSKFKMMLGLWAHNTGTSRQEYEGLLQILRLLRDPEVCLVQFMQTKM
jgi:hypothetical protein